IAVAVFGHFEVDRLRPAKHLPVQLGLVEVDVEQLLRLRPSGALLALGYLLFRRLTSEFFVGPGESSDLHCLLPRRGIPLPRVLPVVDAIDVDDEAVGANDESAAAEDHDVLWGSCPAFRWDGDVRRREA